MLLPPVVIESNDIIGTDRLENPVIHGGSVNDQLLLEKQVLCDDCTTATGSNQLRQGGQQVKQHVNGISPTVLGSYSPAKAEIANYLIV